MSKKRLREEEEIEFAKKAFLSKYNETSEIMRKFESAKAILCRESTLALQSRVSTALHRLDRFFDVYALDEALQKDENNFAVWFRDQFNILVQYCDSPCFDLVCDIFLLACSHMTVNEKIAKLIDDANNCHRKKHIEKEIYIIKLFIAELGNDQYFKQAPEITAVLQIGDAQKQPCE